MFHLVFFVCVKFDFSLSTKTGSENIEPNTKIYYKSNTVTMKYYCWNNFNFQARTSITI